MWILKFTFNLAVIAIDRNALLPSLMKINIEMGIFMYFMLFFNTLFVMTLEFE